MAVRKRFLLQLSVRSVPKLTVFIFFVVIHSFSLSFFLSVVYEFGVLIAVPTFEVTFVPSSAPGFPLSVFSTATYSQFVLI